MARKIIYVRAKRAEQQAIGLEDRIFEVLTITNYEAHFPITTLSKATPLSEKEISRHRVRLDHDAFRHWQRDALDHLSRKLSLATSHIYDKRLPDGELAE